MPTSDHFTAAELARLCAAKGIHHAVISPGSRSAPLVIAFNEQEKITCLQVIDERSAAFFALGMAQQLHAPVALICTSGSAVLNYGPAIAEAFYQRIPLFVITADRPEEWVDQGEGQAIRQQGVLALHMKRSVQLPRSPSDDLGRWHSGRLINEAIDATVLPVPGPVHVNVPFEEPLYGVEQATRLFTAEGQPGRLSNLIAPVMTESFILPDHARWLIHQLSSSLKVMVLAGQGSWSEGLKKQLLQLSAMPQVTVHTEATSNLDDPAYITCIDRAIEGVNEKNENDLKPDVLITFGGAIVSKRVKSLLRKWKPAQHWNIDVGQRHYDTYQSLTHDIAVSPEVFFAQISGSVKGSESMYREAWKMVDERTRGLHHRVVADAPFCDLSVFSILNDRIPGDSDVQVANSTPARYVQLFDRIRGHRWFSNRGTSGIDGCTSTAVGAAHATQKLTTLITGDTAFCYDSNAFWNEHLSPLLKVIIIDNGGGNIFRYIDGPDKDPDLLKWFEAPHTRNIEKLVKSYDLSYYHANDQASLVIGLDRLYSNHTKPAVLHITTDALTSPKVLREYFTNLDRKGERSRAPTTMSRTWTPIKQYTDIRFEYFEGIGKITINRPQVYNAFRPETTKEMIDAMEIAREDQRIGVIILTGEGDKAFCSGGDQNVKGRGGYVGADGVPRLNILDMHKKIREIPKPVVAMVNGYAIGGGHVLHVVCDLTIAADHARFGQTGPKVGSFDAGFGSSYLARHVGQKKAREIWFLCLQYSAKEAEDMGMVNKVVPLAQLEDTTVEWCNIMLQRSPMALRMIKRGLNAELDGQRGLMEFAGDATLMYYMMDEAQEGRNAFMEDRAPDFKQFPKFP